MVATADVVCEPRRQHSLASSAQRFSGMMARVAATELPMANGVRLSGAVDRLWEAGRSLALIQGNARRSAGLHRSLVMRGWRVSDSPYFSD
jgi:hypothetical protein